MLGLVNPFIFLVYIVASVYGCIVEFVPYLETYVIESLHWARFVTSASGVLGFPKAQAKAGIRRK